MSFENKPDSGESKKIPSGRIETWYGGFKTIINDAGKTEGVLWAGEFYQFEDGEELVQKPRPSDPKSYDSFIRKNGDERTDTPFLTWSRGRQI